MTPVVKGVPEHGLTPVWHAFGLTRNGKGLTPLLAIYKGNLSPSNPEGDVHGPCAGFNSGVEGDRWPV